MSCPKCVCVITGSFAGDVAEGACSAEFFLNLGGSGAAVCVGKHSGMWANGARQGSGATTVTIQRVLGGGGAAAVACTTIHNGMCGA